MTRRRWLVVALAAAALLLVAGRVGGALYVDRAWYAAMGAEALWRAKVVNTLLLRGLTALLGSAFVFANLYSVRHSIVSFVLPRRVGDLEIGEEVPGHTLMVVVLLLSGALGALLTIPYGDWTLLAQAWRGRAYGELDPFHQVDLGFWVHWLPLEVALYHWALLALLVVSIVVVALYALTPSLRWDRGSLRVTSYVRRHLVVLGTLALLLLAWNHRLDQYRLLVSGSGSDGLFTWGDHHVRLSANAALAMLSAVVGILVLLTGWMGQVRRAFFGVTAILVLSLVLQQALPAVLERVRAPAEPTDREAAYRRTRATYSRRAVGLETLLPPDSAPRAATGPAFVSAWDERALGAAIARLHRGTTAVGDVGWRAGESSLEALVVTRPASDAGSDPATAWIAARFAPGLGDSGVPDASERPLPPPVVWPGARGHLIVVDGATRVPAAPLASGLARLAHAWGEQNPRFVDPALGAPNTRLVLRRDVRERVRALTPFFAQGGQVTPVLLDGALHWVLHLYAATEWYPLAAPVEVDGREWRSWQHAATAVVEAQTGRVRIVPDPRRDALAETWIAMFPSLFTTADSLPAGMLAQLPPAIDAVMAQATTLAHAGLRREGTPPRRQLADALGDTVAASRATPFAAGGVVAVALPLVDGVGTLSGIMLGRAGLPPRTTWLPSPAPRAVSWDVTRDRLLRGADTTAGRDARLVAGALRVVPLAGGGEALLLSQYRWRADAAPELLRVGAVAGDTARVAGTLGEALGIVADTSGGPGVAGLPADLRARAGALYDRMRDALRRGDWPAFGEAYDELGRTLGRAPR